MRIGFDAKRIFFNCSGLGNYSRSSVANLFKYYGDDQYALFSPKQGNRCRFSVPQEVDIIYPKGVGALAPSLWRSCAMSGAIREEKVDIYHGLSNELPYDIRRSGARSVVTMHDLIFIRYPGLYKPCDRYMYTKKYIHSCRAADRIIAISQQTKQDLVNYWGVKAEKIDVVYQGCSPMFYDKASEYERERIRQKYKLPKEYVLSVGSIETRKNLLLTLKAMVEGRIDINLVACGKHTPYTFLLMKYAEKNGIGSKVQFLHNVNFSDLPAIYQMSSVLVYASIFEGFGIPVIEALNSGVPVITSKGGVFRETGGDACCYVDPFSVDDMIAGLERVLGNSDLRDNMIELGYIHVQQFREQSTARSMMSVYQSIM